MGLVRTLTLALLVVSAPTGAWALTGVSAEGLTALDRFEQRKDVDEVLLPPPPRGPATPIPFCSPGSICP